MSTGKDLKALVAYFIASCLETLVNIFGLALLTALSLMKYCKIHSKWIKKVKPKACKLSEYKKRSFMLAIQAYFVFISLAMVC